MAVAWEHERAADVSLVRSRSVSEHGGKRRYST
jgi:hypothetical protein